MTTELPARADVSQLRGQAKDLRRAVVGGNPAALRRIEGLGRRPEELTLRDAQLVVAREYGFAGWHDLMTEVGRKQIAERDMHRWFGVQLNNETWPPSPPGPDHGHTCEIGAPRGLSGQGRAPAAGGAPDG